jgi:hypothetical protein
LVVLLVLQKLVVKGHCEEGADVDHALKQLQGGVKDVVGNPHGNKQTGPAKKPAEQGVTSMLHVQHTLKPSWEHHPGALCSLRCQANALDSIKILTADG